MLYFRHTLLNKQDTLMPNASEPQPQTNYQPQEPVAPTTPYEQQPVAQQYFAQPQAAPVQYVVQAQSLKGKSGWLMFFMIIAALSSLGYASVFFKSLSDGNIVDTIFSPIMFVLALTALTLIALERKVGKWAYIGFWGMSFIYGVVAGFADGEELTKIATTAVVTLVVLGIVTLYFITSKRVKETLIL